MEQQEIIEASKVVFETHKDENKIIATSDGNFFLEKAKNLAIDHASKLGSKIIVITREEALGEAVETPVTIIHEVTIEERTIPQLKEYAKSKGLTVTKTKKEDIIEEIVLQLSHSSEEEE